jgi:polysaccharide export outer membrane protein
MVNIPARLVYQGIPVKTLCSLVLLVVSPPFSLWAQDRSVDAAVRDYRLGPDDQVSIRVQDLDKLQLDNALAPRIDVNGNLNLPMIGHVHAEGLTLDKLEKEIAAKLSNVLQKPSVSVSIVQYRNHPVSMLGAVRNPAVLQVAQHKRLLEVLSMAGGLAPDAGDKIKISRRKSMGPLPLPGTVLDSSAGFYVGQVDVRTLMQASDPDLNIEVLEHDVITVPRAELVYVIGAVKRAGGFTLGEREKISVLQALSLAEGLDRAASPKSARLLREDAPGKERTQIPINLKPILAGNAPDVALRANDILFIPTSTTKLATMRGIEAAIQMSSGALIYR